MRTHAGLTERADPATLEHRQVGSGAIDERQQDGASIREKLGPAIRLAPCRIGRREDLRLSPRGGHTVERPGGGKHDLIATPPVAPSTPGTSQMVTTAPPARDSFR